MRCVPISDEGERGVLGSVLLEPNKIGKLDLAEKHFYHPKNAKLWGALKNMYMENKDIDTILIAEELSKSDVLDFIGGYDFLLELQDQAVISSHSQHYASLVQNAYRLRQQINILESGLKDAYDWNSPAEDVISALLRDTTEEQEDLTLEQYGNKFLKDCEEGSAGHFKWWCDEWTQHLGKQSSELVLLHAPRSTGKTALMLQWQIAAHQRGDRTPLASIEMLKPELLPRYIAHVGQVNTWTMRTRGFCTKDETERARKALDNIVSLDLCVRDKGMTIEDIRAWAVKEWRHGAQAIFIDNLLSISDGGKQYQSKTIMYDDFIRKFRDLRDDLKIPIIILAHPNMNMEIAWSKDVENFADQIILLHNVPSEGLDVDGVRIMQDYEISGNHVVAKFQKNRQGLSPVASLDFNTSTQTFKHIRWEI